MKRDDTLRDAEEILSRLEETRGRLEKEIEEGLKLGERLREAAWTVGKASSGSWVGWHSRMYYEDYREPPVANSWNAEWGGLREFSPRWRERTIDELQVQIEERAGINLAALAGYADRVREGCQGLQGDVLTLFSPICDLAGLDKEAALLEKLEKIEWIIPPSSFIEAIRPSRLWSRDTGALSQGMQAPLHLDVEAAIVSSTSTLSAGREFLEGAIRLARQVRIKLKSLSLAPQGGRVTAESPNARMARQLRNRSVALFLVIAAVVIAIGVLLIKSFIHDRLVEAVVIVVMGLLVASAYAYLLDRKHAVRALAAAAAISGAIAAIDQLIGHFE